MNARFFLILTLPLMAGFCRSTNTNGQAIPFSSSAVSVSPPAEQHRNPDYSISDRTSTSRTDPKNTGRKSVFRLPFGFGKRKQPAGNDVYVKPVDSDKPDTLTPPLISDGRVLIFPDGRWRIIRSEPAGTSVSGKFGFPSSERFSFIRP